MVTFFGIAVLLVFDFPRAHKNEEINSVCEFLPLLYNIFLVYDGITFSLLCRSFYVAAGPPFNKSFNFRLFPRPALPDLTVTAHYVIELDKM